MQKLSFIICFILLFMAAIGQGLQDDESPYLKADAYLKKTGNFSSAGNVGSLASTNNFSVGVYAEQLYSLSQLRSFRMAMTLPTANSAFQIRMNQLGNNSYYEYTAGIGYGRPLSTNWDVGVAFNYYNVSIQGYGGRGALSFEAGALFHYSDHLRLGVHVGNPVGLSFAKGYGEKLRSSYAAGIGYDLSDKLFMTAQVEKRRGSPTRVIVSGFYQFIDKLAAKWGLSTADASVFFGTAVQLKNIRLDATASIHPRLGVTPGLMVTYERGEK